MRIAVIDIGTNSTRLLIAESGSGKLEVINKRLITTRLGEGIGNTTVLLRPAVDRTIHALRNFCSIIEETGVDTVVVAATSAVRDAGNRREFISEVKSKTGLEVRVLSGTEEAELSYAGVLGGLKTGGNLVTEGKTPVVIDIGGGSTEFIWTRYGALKCISTRVGAVRMTERKASQAEIEEILEEVLDDIRISGAKYLVGVGGTITTAAAVEKKLRVYDPAVIHGYFLKKEAIGSILADLEAMPLDRRKEVPGLQPERADIITAGLRILLTVVGGLDLEGIIVSETDIMYGMAYTTIGTVN